VSFIRAYKTEINPTAEQKQKIHQTIGVCRFVYNFYIAHNKDVYEKQKRFVSGMDFSKWLNNEFIPNNPDKSWIKDVGSKAVKQSIMNGEKAFKSFFDGKSKFPRFKKKNKQDVKAYFPKNNKTDWTVERHRIKMPTLGFVALKEKGYIPTNAKVKSGTFSYKAGRYYVSALVEEDIKILNNNINDGVGIDIGIKNLAVVSNTEKPFKNINKTEKVKELEKKLKREQVKQAAANTVVERLPLPEFLKGSIVNQIPDPGKLIDVSKVMETISGELAKIIIYILSMILLYVFVRIAIIIVKYLLKGITKLPVVKQIDKLGGFALGAVEGLLTVYIVFAILMLFNSSPSFRNVYETIEASKIARFFYENNFIVDFMFPGKAI
jgi:hypothetical protein